MSPLMKKWCIMSLDSTVSCLYLVILNILWWGFASGDTFFKDDLSRFELLPRFTTHPMLYFSSGDIIDLRRKASTTHSHIARELQEAVVEIRNTPSLMPPEEHKKFAKQWNEAYGNVLPVLALHHTLTPDQDTLTFLITAMDRMTAYSDWLVESMPTDEVPVSHSLVGYLTAYDMIYPSLDERRQKDYADKIFQVSEMMYKVSSKRSWGDGYLQNHQASNIVALFMGSLVSELHSRDPAVGQWKRYSLTMYERTMKLLEGIKDGSLDEGVGYVGYTVRSLSQYVCLVKRHLGYDHSAHPWLKKHFEFMYLTIIPGFERTVGIADTPQAWFYGPESQLVFLDAYALRDGRGNWLAQKVKEHKISIMKEKRPMAQRYTTLHTEFLFYDATIKPRAPNGFSKSEMHVFEDWGVMTYRSDSIENKTSSFLSFKSGKIHGDYVNHVANSAAEKDKTMKGWSSFNPGHEHADQNSFTFWVAGEPFVSEGLYGPKLPYLDNVQMFRDKSLASKDYCTYPWVGQLGNCKKWLTWKGKEESHSHGQILAAITKNDMVFVAGDSAEAYTSKLHIDNAFRSVLLLQNNILLVFDHVILDKSSRVSHVGTIFNNYMHRFMPSKHKASRLSGFSLEGMTDFHAFWTTAYGRSPPVNITTNKYRSCGKEISVSNANVTFQVRNKTSSSVFAFVGPGVSVTEFGSFKSTQQVHIHLYTSEKRFRISINLNFKSDQNPYPMCTVVEETSNSWTVFSNVARTNSLHSGRSILLGDTSRSEDAPYLLIFGLVGVAFALSLAYCKLGKIFMCKSMQKKSFLCGFFTAILIFIFFR